MPEPTPLSSAASPSASSTEFSPSAFSTAVVSWFAVAARDLPWRRPGFTAWGTLVSEFMLQQTPVVRVVPRLAEWLARWPTPASLAASPAGDAVRAWQSLGYPRRALNLHACAVAITSRFGGEVPRDVPSLLSLPGVGDYTARAVAVFAYGDRHPVVDTNIRRVIARAVDGAPDAAAPNARRDLPAMAALLPPSDADAARFNAGMMELGALVCTARAPRCSSCPVADLCAWRAAAYPSAPVARRPVQKKYEGSDRQARGIVLGVLRASDDPVPHTALAEALPDPARLGRALAGLLADGLLVTPAADLYALP
ncbi:A/G-specific adenine glycosylase [Herbiconiux sp. CPCC 205716]|uniref:Adenine DNA glycosylase n=1 Tax=Herbiconiux gentiana TaxID=2970912 RepID=A0ABT2GJT3_9MICO|nr:A/G-specific adenine glycosylase [Herbiconiux gentiana]MCS5715036.1 A/G-specific adenine glycosylase [Herbiconiux gentiana]